MTEPGRPVLSNVRQMSVTFRLRESGVKSFFRGSKDDNKTRLGKGQTFFGEVRKPVKSTRHPRARFLIESYLRSTCSAMSTGPTLLTGPAIGPAYPLIGFE